MKSEAVAVSADSIAQARDTDILEIASRYVVLRRAAASEYCGPCPICGGADRFSINIRKNVWACRQCGVGGDPISLIMHVESIGFREAIQRLAGGLGEPTKPRGPVPTRSEAAGDQAEGIARGRGRWRAAVDPRGTIVETYLISRGLELSGDVAGEVIRFHPACPWKDDSGAILHVPVMIAAMRDIRSDEITAVSCRRLTPEGVKVGKPRMRGIALGAVVKLDVDDSVTGALHICEGVETGIAAQMFKLRPVWALGSKDAIKAFPVLAGIGSLTILVEPDAEDQVEQCARRWHQAGREVTLIRATVGKDLADVAMARRRLQ